MDPPPREPTRELDTEAAALAAETVRQLHPDAAGTLDDAAFTPAFELACDHVVEGEAADTTPEAAASAITTSLPRATAGGDLEVMISAAQAYLFFEGCGDSLYVAQVRGALLSR